MRAVTNPSEVESRSSRRRTRTLRNTFNLEANNQLSQIFSNYFEATAIIQHQHQPYTAIGEQQKAEYKEFNLVIQQQNNRKNKSNQIMKEISVAKDELIKSLEQNNRKITYEVQAIWEKIHSISVVKQPTKKHRKLIQEQLNSQKLQKDLQNAYKRIKIAEKQMKSYRNRQQKSTDFVDKLKKLKKDLSEREVIAHRIKGQIAARNIELKQAEKIITIKLNEKSGQGQFKKLSEELNYLLSLVKETQKREQQKINTLKKQYVSVKKIQRELVEKGMSEFQLQQIKKQCMRQFPTKKQLQQKIHSKNEAFKQDKRKQKVEQKERNSKNFNQMVNQVALLQKKQTQFERQYEKIRATKLQYAELNKNLQQKIRSCQIESQKLENLNQKLRSKHIQQHRAKKSQNAEKQLTQIITIPLRSSWKTKQQQILLKQKNKRYKSLPHDLDILTTQPKEEKIKKGVALFGGGSIGCHKFSDKYTLANENRNKKIIGLVVYFQPQRNFISGISVIYEEGIKGGDYVWRLSETQQQYKIQSIQFDQVYVKEIIPNFEKKNTKFKLVGIQLLLSDRTVKKIGKVVNQKGKLQQKEYVSCLHGSMSILTQNGKHVSVIQQLGYQIYQ